MIRNYTLAFTLLLTSSVAFSQTFDWVQSNPINYPFNPEMTQHASCISSSGKIYSGRLVNYLQNFGQDIFGTNSIDCYNSAGQMQWSFSIGQKAVIRKMIADANGNVYIGGSYMETLHFNGTDSLQNTGSGFDVNVYLLSLDPSGNIRWKRNLSLNNNNYTRIEALGVDNSGDFWYGTNDFFNMDIFRTDNTGQDVQTIILQNTRSLGGFCFDPNNNLYASGSTEMGTMSIGSLSVNVPETYMMFVAYIQSNGQGSWIKLAHDVTFQSPIVVADNSGGAYVGGMLMDSTSFGTVSFLGPQWVYDVFLTHVDNNGNFSWGVEVPHVPSITGDFQPGANQFISSDATGKAYLMGICRGVVNWGNGVITGTSSIPSPSREMAIICFDTNGTPLWNLEGGKSDFDMAYSLDIMPNGDGYYSAQIQDTAYFGPNTIFGGSADNTFVVGKITTNVTAIHSISDYNHFLVYPVPAKDMINVDFEVSENQAAIMELNDANGRAVMSKKIMLTAGLNHFYLATDNLSAGVYLLNIKSTHRTLPVSIVIR